MRQGGNGGEDTSNNAGKDARNQSIKESRRRGAAKARAGDKTQIPWVHGQLMFLQHGQVGERRRPKLEELRAAYERKDGELRTANRGESRQFQEKVEDAGDVLELEWMNKAQYTEFFYNKARLDHAHWEDQRMKQTPPGEPFVPKRFNRDAVKLPKEIKNADRFPNQEHKFVVDLKPKYKVPYQCFPSEGKF